MSLLTYEYVSVERTSRGDKLITIHVSEGSSDPRERDEHELMLGVVERNVVRG